MTPCEPFKGPDDSYPNCGQPGCTNRADLLCDAMVPEGGTCDAKICSDHAKEIGPDKHVCPAHVNAATQEKLL